MIGCKKINVGVCKLKNTCKEGHGYLWKKMMDKRMMRMKGKEWGKKKKEKKAWWDVKIKNWWMKIQVKK